MKSRSVAWILPVCMVILATSIASAQPYPNKPIRIVTSAIGGGSDFIARLLGQGLSPSLGQPVVVDNRTGMLASEATSKAPPDGYSLLVTGSGLWILPLLQKAPYDVADFAPISQITREISILTVHPSLPVKSVKELVALAKVKPGELNYSSSPVGSPSHLAAELFRSMAGVKIVSVPYKGAAPALAALLSGEVQMLIAPPSSVLPQIKSGRLRALAVTSAEPSALAPGLPSIAASGVPEYEAVSMTVIFAPAKTPTAVINRLSQEIVRLVSRSDVKEKIFNSGAEAVGSSPEEFAATVKLDRSRVGKVIKDSGIKIDG